MIVLDEQLLAHVYADAIADWYRGSVVDITLLRPGISPARRSINSKARMQNLGSGANFRQKRPGP